MTIDRVLASAVALVFSIAASCAAGGEAGAAPPAPSAEPEPDASAQDKSPAGVEASRQTAAFAGGADFFLCNWRTGAGARPNQYLSYDFDPTVFTTLEGDLCLRNLGLSAGMNLNANNNQTGEIRDWAAYLGYERTYLRASGGRIRGTARWDGKLGAGQSAETEFDSSYQNIDLLYWFPTLLGKTMPWYVGVGYTSFQIPTEITVWKRTHAGSGYGKLTSVLDPDFETRTYTVDFGFDTFAGSMLYFDAGDPVLDSDRQFSFFSGSEDRFGIGARNRISDGAMDAARELNPGVEFVGESRTYFFAEFDASLGARYTRKFRETGRLSVGLGYKLGFIIGDGGSDFGDEDGAMLQPQNYLFYHGPILRCAMRW